MRPFSMSVKQAMARLAPSTRELLQHDFSAAGLHYPPKRLTLIAFKQEKQLLLFGGSKDMRFVRAFAFTSYSGALGPKLREGDMQIPEGIYRITGAGARGMLTLDVDYPNALDRKNAAADHRTELGGEILVHGGTHSTGCVVISDAEMEQVFVAVNDVGFKNTQLIIAPCDLRKHEPAVDYSKQPKWLPAVYAALRHELSKYSTP